MGTLVFQATLGGSVNLIGPNTASTINFTLPSADGSSGQTWTTNGSGVLSFGTLGVAGGGTGVTTSTGTGSVVLSTSPTLVTPALGTPSALVGTNITGTAANFNINGTVGATTATTGAFTTLAASSTVTLSGGTANGVTYLNGSKVLTSGSALTFDGTNFTAPRTQVTTAGSPPAAGAGIELIGSTSPLILAYNRGTSAYISLNYTASAMQWNIGASAAMLLDASANLGIGTSSPAYKLDVAGSTRVGTSGGATYLAISGNTTSTGSYLYADTNQLIISQVLAKPIYFNTTDITRMTLDAAGNLGLGVTPSAWSGYKAIEVGAIGCGISVPNNANTNITSNSYNNGTSWIYGINGYAGRYSIQASSGSHIWFNSSSGTAGNAISFTQAMTLDANSNLTLGQTTSTARLTVQSGVANGTVAQFGGSSGGSDPRGLTIKTFSSNGGGDCGVDFNAAINNTSYGSFKFSAGSATLASIDYSGNLLVGTTGDISNGGFAFNPLTTGSGNSYQTIGHKSGTASGDFYIGFYYAGGPIGSITQNGTTATAYNTSSDYRLKNTIAPMTGALAKVALLKPCTYKWNADGSDGEGFIAHELAEVCPSAVTGAKDAVDADGKIKSQGIDTSFLVATLTAAIQEQQAIIESLKARLDAANL
jgi:hypothetical protein